MNHIVKCFATYLKSGFYICQPKNVSLLSFKRCVIVTKPMKKCKRCAGGPTKHNTSLWTRHYVVLCNQSFNVWRSAQLFLYLCGRIYTACKCTPDAVFFRTVHKNQILSFSAELDRVKSTKCFYDVLILNSLLRNTKNINIWLIEC